MYIIGYIITYNIIAWIIVLIYTFILLYFKYIVIIINNSTFIIKIIAGIIKPHILIIFNRFYILIIFLLVFLKLTYLLQGISVSLTISFVTK